MEVEVNQSDAVWIAVAQVTSDGAELDGAVPAEDQRDLPLLNDIPDAPRGPGGLLDNGLEVLGARSIAVRSPTPDGTVAMIYDRHAALA
jgi:hypothetical protein